MTKPRRLVAGNWKMNLLRAEALTLARDIARRAGAAGAGGLRPKGLGAEILLCPPATLLMTLAEVIGESLGGGAGGIALGGQDCHPAEKGAHTGDISAPMLKDAGCRYVILGHSERRRDHGESDALIRAKARTARNAGLVPIICVGETEAERDAGSTLDVVASQLGLSLPDDFAAGEFVVAYEPVWAIGTGRTPTEADVALVHAHIRAHLGERAVPILYGGSVKAENAAVLLGIANVDGALVGGASLDAEEFWAIVRAAGASGSSPD